MWRQCILLSRPLSHWTCAHIVARRLCPMRRTMQLEERVAIPPAFHLVAHPIFFCRWLNPRVLRWSARLLSTDVLDGDPAARQHLLVSQRIRAMDWMAPLVPHLVVEIDQKVLHNLPTVCGPCRWHMEWWVPPWFARSRTRRAVRPHHLYHGSRACGGVLVTTRTIMGALRATVERFPGGFISGPRRSLFWSGPIFSFLCIFHHGFISCPHGGPTCLGSRSPQRWFIFPIPFF